jgi:hypothetical protein
MKSNLHSFDRIARILFGAVVAILIFTGMITGTAAWVLGAIAVVFTVTAIINFCPIYYALGFSTRKRSKQA